MTEKIEKELQTGKPALKIGDSIIYQGQIDALMEITPGFRAGWASPEDRKILVSQIVEQELFFQKAKKDDLLSNNPRLQKNLWLQIRNYQAGTYLLQEVDKRARAQYEKDKNTLFSQVEIRDIVYFYNKTGVEKPEEQQKIAMKKAQELRKKLNSKNFSEMAAKETDNAIAKADGGKIGTVNMIDQRIRFMGWKDLISEAFKLGKGKISGPIVTAEGVHIIQPISDKQTQSFEDVLPFLRSSLEAEVKKDVLDQMLKENKIEYLDPSLK